ncbi:MAG: hypothetical protein HY820_03470 [Acidobacteria bacterium]|nr:hypothetical protein [Acidobacteriota bacterium]
MPDEISLVEYYVAVIPHKAGEGARILTAFKEAGMNLEGFLGYWKTTWDAEIVLILDEGTKGVSAAGKKAGLQLGEKRKGIMVKGKDRPGVIAELMCRLADAGINVNALHALSAGSGRFGALIAVSQADLRKTTRTLGMGRN